MTDTRFWLVSKLQLQFLATCEIRQQDLVSVSFGINSGGHCLLTVNGFIQLGKRFGITQVTHFRGVPGQPRFCHEGLEFTCVCTDDEMEMVAKQFRLLEASF